MKESLDRFASVKKIALRGNNKPNMTSQLRKAIMKILDLKIKNNSGKTTVKKAYNKQRNLVVKLNKEAKKSF